MLDGFCLCWQGSNLVTEQICTLEKTLLTTVVLSYTRNALIPVSSLQLQWACALHAALQPCMGCSYQTHSPHLPGMGACSPSHQRATGELRIPLYAEKLLPESPGAWKVGGNQEGVMIKLMFSPVSLCMWRSITAGTASNAAVLVLSPRLLKYGCLSIRERCKRRKAENSLWAIWKQLMNYHS